jgi:hypothetical protein
MRVASTTVDEAAVRRVQRRLSQPTGDIVPGLDVALDRSREQLEALAATAAEIEAELPANVSHAVRDGLRAEVLPVARHIAELRGLFNQANRRLERIEATLLAERKARIEDLALLVELVGTGWRGVDTRLARLEALHDATASGPIERLPTERTSAPTPDDQPKPAKRAAAA